jgi:hypothetical protein
MLQNKEPWDLLRDFFVIFVWHKDELNICTLNAIDTHGFPFYKPTTDFFKEVGGH